MHIQTLITDIVKKKKAYNKANPQLNYLVALTHPTLPSLPYPAYPTYPTQPCPALPTEPSLIQFALNSSNKIAAKKQLSPHYP